MPRYYFHCEDGRTFHDDNGLELPDLAAAQHEALQLAAASSAFAPPNCSRSILPKAGSGSSTRTVYMSFLT